MMAGKLVEATQYYQKIDSLQPNTLPILFNLASINAKRGHNLQTQLYLEKIIKIDTLNFKAWKQLANFTDSIPLKISYLIKANKINPIDAEVASDLATSYRFKKLIEPAYHVLNIAIAADTGNYILQQQQLPLANELKKYREVISVGERLLRDEQDPNVLKDVGKAYFFLRNYEKCLFNYKRIEQMAKQNESTLYYMNLCYRELKNYGMAVVYAKKTIEEGISPNIASYYSLLGGIYENRNQLNSSISAYKKGLTFNANSTIYYKLALINDFKLNKKKQH
jgi:tetratricopeptide (TPR) repeat protein